MKLLLTSFLVLTLLGDVSKNKLVGYYEFDIEHLVWGIELKKDKTFKRAHTGHCYSEYGLEGIWQRNQDKLLLFTRNRETRRIVKHHPDKYLIRKGKLIGLGNYGEAKDMVYTKSTKPDNWEILGVWGEN